MARLKLVGDESRSERAFALAAYIAPVEKWDCFTTEWLEVLVEMNMPRRKDGRVVAFHMTDFESRRPPYDSWSEEKRLECISRLISIINRTISIGFTCCVPVRLMHKIIPLPYKKEKLRQINEYMLCYYFMFTPILQLLFKTNHERMPVFFDRNEVCAGMVKSVHVDLVASSPEVDKRVEPPIFENKEICIPIQSADILAFETMKNLDNRVLANGKTRLSHEALERSRLVHYELGEDQLDKAADMFYKFALSEGLV